ncbi:hypothetical protein OAG1_16600 [Agarivorans sp. OAG1]|jgi:predicted sulfurtransferase|uniref:DUF1107 domain-containing protein n=2 Tax=Agarivorans TaxID=261825 RepID=R9PQI6_AGAAL|nr:MULTISPECIES: DUF1107 family protein [Agarivorans]BEU02860.1 hypothetical protein OAG1_16600 [Agarivorans sp. OAG1]MEE1672931.1 DUF1107 family protein [Agarivorans aestuarii]MPW28623.1 DUF1107 family protein [Agarivorans sp. B2Z047]UQN41184.1 DUF1107 domain-containing protein [Agarivorans sp. B2Z047]GAD03662.1 hypothetical protein AALB_3742 [Agarivorans albus MKT 106]
MKIFSRYSPVKIARYVKAFFKGRLYIQGRGAYEFKNGKLETLANHKTTKHRQTVAEVNQHIDEFKNKAA